MSVDDAKHLTLFVARLVRVSIDGGYGGLCYAHLHTYSDRCLISYLCARCTVRKCRIFIPPFYYDFISGARTLLVLGSTNCFLFDRVFHTLHTAL